MSSVDRLQLPVVLSRDGISRVRCLALRSGVWFRALTRVERACVDVALRVVGGRVRSLVLKRLLSSILAKLEQAMTGRVQRLMREVGGVLALRLSQVAVSWGNRSAVSWSSDAGFVRFLAVNYMNASV
jgi:hypothetical protein